MVELVVAPVDVVRRSLETAPANRLVVAPVSAGRFATDGSMRSPAAGLGLRGSPTIGDNSSVAGVGRESANSSMAPGEATTSATLPSGSASSTRLPLAPAQQGLGSIDASMSGAGVMPPHSIGATPHAMPALDAIERGDLKSPGMGAPAFGQRDAATIVTPAEFELPLDPKAMRPPTNPRPPKIAPDPSQRGKGGGGIAAFAGIEPQREWATETIESYQARRTIAEIEASGKTRENLESLFDSKARLQDVRSAIGAVLDNRSPPPAGETLEARAQREATLRQGWIDADGLSPEDRAIFDAIVQNEIAKEGALGKVRGDFTESMETVEAAVKALHDADAQAAQLGRQLGLTESDINIALKDPKSQVRKLIDQEKARQDKTAADVARRREQRAERDYLGAYANYARDAIGASRTARDNSRAARNQVLNVLSEAGARSTFDRLNGRAVSKEAAAAIKAAKSAARHLKDLTETGNTARTLIAMAEAVNASSLAAAAVAVETAVADSVKVAAGAKDKSPLAQAASQARADADVRKAELELTITKALQPDPKSKTSLLDPFTHPTNEHGVELQDDRVLAAIAAKEALKLAEEEAKAALDLAFEAGAMTLDDTTWPHCPSTKFFPSDCCKVPDGLSGLREKCKPGESPGRKWVNKCTGLPFGPELLIPEKVDLKSGVKGKGDPRATRDFHPGSDTRGSDPGSRSRRPLPPIERPTRQEVRPPGQRGPDEESQVFPGSTGQAAQRRTVAPTDAEVPETQEEQTKAEPGLDPHAKRASTRDIVEREFERLRALYGDRVGYETESSTLRKEIEAAFDRNKPELLQLVEGMLASRASGVATVAELQARGAPAGEVEIARRNCEFYDHLMRFEISRMVEAEKYPGTATFREFVALANAADAADIAYFSHHSEMPPQRMQDFLAHSKDVKDVLAVYRNRSELHETNGPDRGSNRDDFWRIQDQLDRSLTSRAGLTEFFEGLTGGPNIPWWKRALIVAGTVALSVATAGIGTAAATGLAAGISSTAGRVAAQAAVRFAVGAAGGTITTAGTALVRGDNLSTEALAQGALVGGLLGAVLPPSLNSSLPVASSLVGKAAGAYAFGAAIGGLGDAAAQGLEILFDSTKSFDFDRLERAAGGGGLMALGAHMSPAALQAAQRAGRFVGDVGSAAGRGFVQDAGAALRGSRSTAASGLGSAGEAFVAGVKGAAREAGEAVQAKATRLGIVRENRADWRRTRDVWDSTGYDDILSPENRAHVAGGRTPKVDSAWIRHFPEDAGLRGQDISMHHIDASRVTVPLPESRHLDAHLPGGFRYNPGGPGGGVPIYPEGSQ
jgi:hypothetical protein